MQDRFAEKVADKQIGHDMRVLADFVAIYCDGHHADRARARVTTDAAVLGVYRKRVPVLCDECVAHLAYAEKRRAYCPMDPKPFCAHCETHCYKSDERVWQRDMMRYSGPKSWRKGHAIDGIRHVMEARKWRREMERRQAATATKEETAS